MPNITSEPNPDSSLRKICQVDMSCDAELDVPYPLPPHHYCMLFDGKPGSGKTNLIYNLIAMPGKFYHRKYNRVYFFTHSAHTINARINLPKERIIEKFDFETLHSVLDEIQDANKIFKARNDDQPHNLIILDDVVAEFKRGIHELKAMVFNRRHYHMSVIMVTQVYNQIPLELRKCCDTLVIFNTSNGKEVHTIHEEFLGHLTREQLKAMWKYVFDQRHNFLFIRADIVPAMEGMFKNFDKIVMEPHINNSYINL